jgi:hypothetical protein
VRVSGFGFAGVWVRVCGCLSSGVRVSEFAETFAKTFAQVVEQ